MHVDGKNVISAEVDRPGDSPEVTEARFACDISVHGSPGASHATTSAAMAMAPAHPLYDRAKRALDCLVALGILWVFSPLWLLIALAIKCSSRGPVLFTRTVIGRAGRPFVYYKFRTMHHRNDDSVHHAFIENYVKGNGPFTVVRDPATGEERPVFKVVNDPRVTPVGRVLRRLSVDEIPQLVNVLRGEMSLVGPRPPIEVEYQLYDEATRARLAVLPGLTGLAQVHGRSSLSFAEMVALDKDYIARRSLWLDLRIIGATAKVMLSGQ